MWKAYRANIDAAFGKDICDGRGFSRIPDCRPSSVTLNVGSLAQVTYTGNRIRPPDHGLLAIGARAGDVGRLAVTVTGHGPYHGPNGIVVSYGIFQALDKYCVDTLAAGEAVSGCIERVAYA